LSVAGSARRLVGHVIEVGCFRTSAPKTENGFVAQENCFVGPAGRNNGRKISMNSAAMSSLERIRLNPASRRRFGSPLMDKDGRIHWLAR
jgi:hypothetical protein